jgi:UDP-N-acetyl-D-glucosamine dehydrogenase
VVRARGPRETETVKVLETNFRHVDIALVNEMAVLCHDLGVDLWDVIRCAETKPSGNPFAGDGAAYAPVPPPAPVRDNVILGIVVAIAAALVGAGAYGALGGAKKANP